MLDKVKDSDKQYWILNVDGDYYQSNYFDTPKDDKEYTILLTDFFKRLPERIKDIVEKDIDIDKKVNKYLYVLNKETYGN